MLDFTNLLFLLICFRMMFLCPYFAISILNILKGTARGTGTWLLVVTMTITILRNYA